MYRAPWSWILAALVVPHPLVAQTTSRESVSSAGAQGNQFSDRPAITWNGEFVVFATGADLDPAGFGTVMIRDRATGAIERVDVAWDGSPPNGGNALRPAVSGEGGFVAFRTFASNIVPGDTNNRPDIFVRDRQLGTSSRVSVATGGAQANDGSQDPAISVDGRFVAFVSTASNLVAGDTNDAGDVFVHDRLLGETTRVSVSTAGAQAFSDPAFPTISADGRYVAFDSFSSSLVVGDTNGVNDVFVHDRVTGTTSLVSLAADATQGNGGSFAPSISADGRWVAFESIAINLVPPGTHTHPSLDVFVKDLSTGEVLLVSVTPGGTDGDERSRYPWISPDGRYVAFESLASNLVPGDANSLQDVFVRDLQGGTTRLASLDPIGAQGNNFSRQAAISNGGRHVAFASDATNLVHADTNGFQDVFVRSLGATADVFCPGDGVFVPCPCFNAGEVAHGCDNSAGTGGAVLSTSGTTSPDTVRLHGTHELPSALTIFVQSDTVIAAVPFGDGLRCLGGTLRRLYSRGASFGNVTAPGTGDPSITARSAALGDPLSAGAVRHYMTYYRDANPGFCGSPFGGTFNASNALSIIW